MDTCARALVVGVVLHAKVVTHLVGDGRRNEGRLLAMIHVYTTRVVEGAHRTLESLADDGRREAHAT